MECLRGVSKKPVGCSYRQVVDPHSADGSTVVAEVVLNGRVGHLGQGQRSEAKHRKMTVVRKYSVTLLL